MKPIMLKPERLAPVQAPWDGQISHPQVMELHHCEFYITFWHTMPCSSGLQQGKVP